MSEQGKRARKSYHELIVNDQASYVRDSCKSTTRIYGWASASLVTRAGSKPAQNSGRGLAVAAASSPCLTRRPTAITAADESSESAGSAAGAPGRRPRRRGAGDRRVQPLRRAGDPHAARRAGGDVGAQPPRHPADRPHPAEPVERRRRAARHARRHRAVSARRLGQHLRAPPHRSRAGAGPRARAGAGGPPHGEQARLDEANRRFWDADRSRLRRRDRERRRTGGRVGGAPRSSAARPAPATPSW